jgi:hypothetical protein
MNSSVAIVNPTDGISQRCCEDCCIVPICGRWCVDLGHSITHSPIPQPRDNKEHKARAKEKTQPTKKDASHQEIELEQKTC